MKINDKHISYFASCNDVLPDKEGWLLKKGELNTSYQKRWCVLKGNLFFYFEKRSDKEPIGVIILENCSVQLAEGGDSPFTFCIQFAGEGTRVYKLTADDEDTCMAWVKLLSCCSYRYLDIMVESLQREIDIAKTKAPKLNPKRSYDSSSKDQAEVCDMLPITENYFSNQSSKSCSVDNVTTSMENDVENFIMFNNNTDDSLSSPKLGRSRSSQDLLFSPDVKNHQTKPKTAKANVLKKLSPRPGRKRDKNFPPKESGHVLNNANSKLNQNSNENSLVVIKYNFLEIHNQFKKQIELFVAKVESSV